MNNTVKSTLVSGAAFCGLAVILGAFAAHGLKSTLPPKLLETFKTGVDYQFFHGLGLLLLAALAPHLNTKWMHRTARLFTLGVLLFSGSLYLLALLQWSWLGPVTPLGGLCFIGAWACLCVAALKGKA